MPDIKLKVEINAGPEKVYEALTEQKHFELWWTPDCTVEPEVGTESRFEFNPHGDYIVLIVTKLEPNKLVEWKVTDSKMMGTPEWINTTITFELSEKDGKTELSFTHEDWKDETECFKKCTDGWKHFVADSLKSYLETGEGKPFIGK